jgi:hypothetical protein
MFKKLFNNSDEALKGKNFADYTLKHFKNLRKHRHRHTYRQTGAGTKS